MIVNDYIIVPPQCAFVYALVPLFLHVCILGSVSHFKMWQIKNIMNFQIVALMLQLDSNQFTTLGEVGVVGDSEKKMKENP